MKHAALAIVLVFLSACSSGYRIPNNPLSPTAGAWTATTARSYFFLGSIDFDRQAAGGNWCILEGINGRPNCISNDIVDGVFTSCTALLPNGVLTGVNMVEVNKRTWSMASARCQDMDAAGNFGGPISLAPMFAYGTSGTGFSATIPAGMLPVGAINQHKAPGSNRLRSIKLYYATPAAIWAMGQSGAGPSASSNVFLAGDFAPPVPTGVWTGIGSQNAFCLPGNVITGAFIGHKLNNAGDAGNVWYLIGECRPLLYVPPSP